MYVRMYIYLNSFHYILARLYGFENGKELLFQKLHGWPATDVDALSQN